MEKKTNTFLPDIKMAVKRARHFSQNLSWGGPFSPIGKEGLSIPIRNGLWFLDLKESNTEDDYAAELLAIHWISRKINDWIDNHLVENDEEAKVALAAFLSRADTWCNWDKLEEKKNQGDSFVSFQKTEVD